MTERPIIMSGESVRAILAGTKTQTRRPLARRLPVDFVGGEGQRDDLSCWGYWVEDMYGRWAVLARGLDQPYAHGCVSIPCPYGVPGDRLWVRETWGTSQDYDGVSLKAAGFYDRDPVWYAAEIRLPGDYGRGRVRSPIHMPRWASRIALELTDVRVQRLQEISEEDAKAEGVAPYKPEAPGSPCSEGPAWFRMGFRDEWELINGKRAPWVSNPWVWALSFKVIQ